MKAKEDQTNKGIKNVEDIVKRTPSIMIRSSNKKKEIE